VGGTARPGHASKGAGPSAAALALSCGACQWCDMVLGVPPGREHVLQAGMLDDHGLWSQARRLQGAGIHNALQNGVRWRRRTGRTGSRCGPGRSRDHAVRYGGCALLTACMQQLHWHREAETGGLHLQLLERLPAPHLQSSAISAEPDRVHHSHRRQHRCASSGRARARASRRPPSRVLGLGRSCRRCSRP